ncbi:MAG: VWA domain-containing protein [Armatimonadetes bacterium]|nr:VWA domain-containing protein [Armatimonadota bacterium]
MTRPITRLCMLVAALALLGAVIAGCGDFGATLPSPGGGGPIVPGNVTVNMAPSLAGAAVPCPLPRADLTLYEAPDVAAPTGDTAAVPGTWVQRTITTWTDNRNCGGGGGQNADVSLVLDASGSMGTTYGASTRIEALREAAKQLVSMMGANDRAEVIQFGCMANIAIVQDFTSDKGALNTAIDGIGANWGCTAVWSGGKLGVDELVAKGRTGVGHAVILVTDGGDNDSDITPADLIAAAQAASLPIYTVGVDAAADPNLAQVASETGGEFVQANDPSALSAAFAQIFQTVTGGTANVTWTTTLNPGDDVWVKLVYKEGTADEETIGPMKTKVPSS